MASLQSLQNNGLNNDGAAIQTDGSGNIISPKGQLRNVSILATPFHLTTNPTVNNGVTSTLTCTGGSTGVPTGAIAVFLGIGINCATAGGNVLIAPHGGTLGQYMALTGQVAGQYTTGFGLAPLDSTGKIDVKANGSNIVLQDWYIYGYVN